MLKLIGRADVSGPVGPVTDDVWRVELPEDQDSRHNRVSDEAHLKSIACLLKAGQPAPPGYRL